MNLRTISSSYGEFTPLVLEGTVLFQTKDKTPCTSLTTAGRLPPWRSALERLTPANSFRERK